MPQPVAELEEPDPLVRRDDIAVLVEVGEIGDAGTEPLLDRLPDMPRRAIVLQLAEMPGEDDLLFVGQILVAEHQHRVTVHAGFDRRDLLAR